MTDLDFSIFRPCSPPNRTLNLNGRIFGRLTVLGYMGRAGGGTFWLCRCACNNLTQARTSHLQSGQTQSCGCLQKEGASLRQTTHGRTNTPEFRAWNAMINRCYGDPDKGRYRRYAGRGIVICDHWRHSFENFYADMGDRPGKGYSIDRKDNDGNYSCGKCDQCIENGWPMNCRWATLIEQGNNKATNRLIEYQGKTMSVMDWCRELGLPRSRVWSRLWLGWTPERAFTEPVQVHRKFSE